MLNLASAILAMFFYVHHSFNMSGVPMPVVIENGKNYSYNEIYSEIRVPDEWSGDCDSQRKLLRVMELHFNAYRNGNQKFTEARLNKIQEGWVCVE